MLNLALMWVANNPVARLIAEIFGALIAGLLFVTVLIRRDRKTRRLEDAQRDHARADRLRDRGRDAATRELRPGDIRYRD